MSHTHDSSRPTALVAFGAALAFVLLSCGVPTGDSTFEAIDADEVPNRLNDPTTTTPPTTSTTTTTTLPEIPDSTIATTTEPPPQVASVDIYFVSRGVLQPLPSELPEGFGINQLVARLEAGPPGGSLGVGLDTFVERGLISGQPQTDRGVITIDLDPDVFDDINPRNQRQAIAQIVFTLLKNTTAVGQVAFTRGGEPFLVPTDAGSREVATTDDFSSLESGGSRPTTTLPLRVDPPNRTTTTTSTTTTP